MKFSSICKTAMFAMCLGLGFAGPALPATAAALGQPSPLAAINPAPLTVNIRAGHGVQQIVVPEGKSRLVEFDRSFRQIVVGSKEIAHVVSLSGRSIYVMGKKRGTTNLTITDGRRHVVAVVDVVVTYDVDGLDRQLSRLVPGSHVEITPAGNALVLSGSVDNAADLHTIAAVADRYAPGQITNLLQVGGSQQVMLEVKFSEVQRSMMHDLGVTVLNGNAATKGLVSPAGALPAAISEFGTYGGLLTDASSYTLRAKLNAMEKKGFIRTLAEPNLVALTGQTASFLAGGEFPIPVVQSSTGVIPTTTIEYKNFGVGLSFTPTILTADKVNLVVKSEVSALDDSASVTTNGIDVPGLKVRRASTTVDLRDGQTFAIAGMIQDDYHNSIDAIPGLGDIPVLGALFRSSDFQHNRSELVIFITVRLVQPTDGVKLAAPTDTAYPPSLGDLTALGKTELRRPSPNPPPQMPQTGANSDAKSEGYVLP